MSFLVIDKIVRGGGGDNGREKIKMIGGGRVNEKISDINDYNNNVIAN